MLSPFDEQMLRRALRVAMNGRGRVEPNPMVGCVLVKNETIIAEGYHAHFGGPHAEPAALADCAARGHDPRGATGYVTLEPCCHTNKKTPPCAPKLIEAGIARVVIGCLDPNPDVDGKGMWLLHAAGIVVDVADGQLGDVFRQSIAPFAEIGPYVTLKWAQSANGRIAGPRGRPTRITSAASTLAVHRLRTRCHGIVVGIGTVLSDDPLLSVRDVPVIRQPLRCILDRRLRTPPDCRMLTDQSGGMVRIVCDDTIKRDEPDRYAALDRTFADIVGGGEDATGRLGIGSAGSPHEHILVEPGPTLAQSLLPWVDRLWVFECATRLPSGPDVPQAAAVPTSYIETGRVIIGGDTLVEYLNPDAWSFVTATPSADFVLEAEHAAAS